MPTSMKRYCFIITDEPKAVLFTIQRCFWENAMVGLGAVVTKSVEKDTVVAGVPAKSIRKVRKEER